ncbi:MAG: LysM peptidoglycan-binding domain-containing protein [Deltaproteobacteria bacterium]|nr:MAG: LysM peptidoglycan-binding domain-containing protein [Deltaproteobacteria bacterium]
MIEQELPPGTEEWIASVQHEFDIPVFINDEVRRFLVYFQTKGRKTFTRWLARSSRYLKMMKDILREEGLPEDLVYLALIESGFSTHARSRAKAVGPWQFMYRTGIKFGLKIDWWIDERRDPEKSTRAAAKYLKCLYERFNSWELAAAAYNAGEYKIIRAMQRHDTEDFWEMSRYRYLRRETKNYVPKFIAAAIIAKHPVEFGFEKIEYQTPIAYDKVRIPDATDLGVIAKACGVGYQEIKLLNPELRRWFTPPGYPGYQVKIPMGSKAQFDDNFTKIKPRERITFRRHVVDEGETLSEIAELYSCGVREIMRINNLRSSHWIRVGKNLIIPVRRDFVPRKRKRIRKEAAVIANTKENHYKIKEVTYRVKKGDTLWDIGREYGIKPSQIRHWNNIRFGEQIYPGDELKLKIKSDTNT